MTDLERFMDSPRFQNRSVRDQALMLQAVIAMQPELLDAPRVQGWIRANSATVAALAFVGDLK